MTISLVVTQVLTFLYTRHDRKFTKIYWALKLPWKANATVDRHRFNFSDGINIKDKNSKTQEKEFNSSNYLYKTIKERKIQKKGRHRS